jgi:hypothetical protein
MKIKRRLFIKILKHLGCSDYASKCYADLWLEDIASENKIPWKKKIWAYRRGFLSCNSLNYGLTETNYRHYLSDLDYARMFPINSAYRKWIDDKVTMKMVLAKYNEFLPEYYYTIRKDGRILTSVDLESSYTDSIDDMIRLLKDKGNLAAKMVDGKGGVGFYRLTFDGKQFMINQDTVDDDKLHHFLKNLHGYILTEYITSHLEISKYNNKPNNTIRFMVINEDGNCPIIANGLLKMSVNTSSEVDYTMQGGICARIDMNTGDYSHAKITKDLMAYDIERHPISGLEIKGTIPHWQMVKDKVCEISQYISEIQYMGYDIIITDTSFKIIEINSHQDIDWHQDYVPLLKDNPAEAFFKALQSKIKSNK